MFLLGNKVHQLDCEKWPCDGTMKKQRKTTGPGCLLFLLIVFLFFFFPFGTILAVVMLVMSLVMSKRGDKNWVCRKCGTTVERM